MIWDMSLLALYPFTGSTETELVCLSNRKQLHHLSRYEPVNAVEGKSLPVEIIIWLSYKHFPEKKQKLLMASSWPVTNILESVRKDWLR